jgi:hypothetical protein
MAKRKNMKADKPEFGGCVTWDGNIQVKIPNHGLKTLRTDLGGLKLQKADPNKELLVLTRNHVGYNEIDTGYIVRTKNYDGGKPPYFGLKDNPDAESWGCHNYCDVIAWGYADGGLNDPTLYYSCQSTIEEEAEREVQRAAHGMKTHAERLAEMEAEQETETEWADDFENRRCVKFRVEDDNIVYNALMGIDEEQVRGGTELMHACAKVFCDFRKEHPEVTEMHFYTDELLDVKQ